MYRSHAFHVAGHYCTITKPRGRMFYVLKVSSTDRSVFVLLFFVYITAQRADKIPPPYTCSVLYSNIFQHVY